MDATARARREFAKQAAAFGDPALTLAQTDLLTWITDRLPLAPGDRVLDVAAGTGHLSRAIAPHVALVVALDVTVEMLHELRKQPAASDTTAPAPVRSLAERLPVRDNVFDLVVSRLAFHHFDDPAAVLHEMIRSCRRGGVVAVIDLMAPDDEALAEVYNGQERRRDPSHTRALREGEMTALLERSGLTLDACVARDVEVDVERWLGLAKTPRVAAADVRATLRAELSGVGPRTGMRPFYHDGDLTFLQRWAIFVSKKPA